MIYTSLGELTYGWDSSRDDSAGEVVCPSYGFTVIWQLKRDLHPGGHLRRRRDCNDGARCNYDLRKNHCTLLPYSPLPRVTNKLRMLDGLPFFSDFANYQA